MAPTLDLFILLASPMIGSFAETAYRRQSVSIEALSRRSQCNNCATPISPIRLIPIAGYLLSGAKCDTCGSRISPYYLATELGFLLITIWAYLAAPASVLYPSIVLGWLLVLLARIDFETYILPDPLNLAVAALGLSVLPYAQSDLLFDRLAGFVVGFALLWGVEWAYKRWRGRSGLGRGDAKLLAALGLWVGLSGISSVLLIASISGLGVALLAATLGRQKLERQSVIAFGPWLAFGGWVTWIYGPLLVR